MGTLEEKAKIYGKSAVLDDPIFLYFAQYVSEGQNVKSRADPLRVHMPLFRGDANYGVGIVQVADINLAAAKLLGFGCDTYTPNWKLTLSSYFTAS